jgi:hypothetical protein
MITFRPEEILAVVYEIQKKCPLPALMAVKEYTRFAYGMDTQAANDFAKNVHATINSSLSMRP